MIGAPPDKGEAARIAIERIDRPLIRLDNPTVVILYILTFPIPLLAVYAR